MAYTPGQVINGAPVYLASDLLRYAKTDTGRTNGADGARYILSVNGAEFTPLDRILDRGAGAAQRSANERYRAGLNDPSATLVFRDWALDETGRAMPGDNDFNLTTYRRDGANFVPVYTSLRRSASGSTDFVKAAVNTAVMVGAVLGVGTALAAATGAGAAGAAAVDAGVGGSGLLAGTGTTGLVATPGAGLTLAAPTFTGTGLIAGTGVDIIGAGIGASVAAAPLALSSVDAGVGAGAWGAPSGQGLVAGTGTTGLQATAGQGLTLAAETGTGSGLTLSSSAADVIGAGIGDSIISAPLAGYSWATPGVAAASGSVASALPTLGQISQAVKTIPVIKGIVDAVTGNTTSDTGTHPAVAAQQSATTQVGSLVVLALGVAAAVLLYKATR